MRSYPISVFVNTRLLISRKLGYNKETVHLNDGTQNKRNILSKERGDGTAACPLYENTRYLKALKKQVINK